MALTQQQRDELDLAGINPDGLATLMRLATEKAKRPGMICLYRASDTLWFAVGRGHGPELDGARVRRILGRPESRQEFAEFECFDAACLPWVIHALLDEGAEIVLRRYADVVDMDWE